MFLNYCMLVVEVFRQHSGVDSGGVHSGCLDATGWWSQSRWMLFQWRCRIDSASHYLGYSSLCFVIGGAVLVDGVSYSLPIHTVYRKPLASLHISFSSISSWYQWGMRLKMNMDMLVAGLQDIDPYGLHRFR